MELQIVGGSLVSRGNSIVFEIFGQEASYLSVDARDLARINVDLHVNGFTRFQCVPCWSQFKQDGFYCCGKVQSYSLRETKDLEGQLGFIRKKLQIQGLDVVLFNGKRGWIVGRNFRQEILYESLKQEWVCEDDYIRTLIQKLLSLPKVKRKRKR